MNHVITVRNRVITLPNTLNLISHSQALDTISFDVDAEWNGFRKIAVFKAGHDAPVEVAVGTNVTIPAEVLRKTGYIVIGLYGTKDEKIMPTLWSDRICVDIGTDTDGVGATPATAPLYEQALTKAEQAVATVQTFDSRITSAQNAASAAQSAVASKADATTVSTLAQTVAGKADSTTVSALAQTVSGKAESSAVSALATEVSEALAGKQDTISDLSTIRSNAQAVSGKQDAIADLDSIRSGAALGTTALQEHQSLAAYRTAAEQDAIHDGTKQDVISDLSAIRLGASAGSTALQSVPNTYRTASAQDALIDSNFKTAATSSTAPAWTSDEKAAACSRIGADRKLADGWVLVATMTSAAGVSVDLTGKTELAILSIITSTGNLQLTANNTSVYLISTIGANSTRRAYARFVDGLFGIEPIVYRYSDNNTAIYVQGSAYMRPFLSTPFYVKDITNIQFASSSAFTSGTIKIYAR